jgi:hypothetical protein
MSEMSYMEKLLDGVEVEWKALGEVCAIKTGPNINKNVIANRPGFYPVINSGREPLGYVEPVRKALVFAVGHFARPPFFHTSQKKCGFCLFVFFRA